MIGMRRKEIKMIKTIAFSTKSIYDLSDIINDFSKIHKILNINYSIEHISKYVTYHNALVMYEVEKGKKDD